MNIIRALPLIAALLASMSATATTVVPPTFDQLVVESEQVFRGVATGIRCEWKGTGDQRRIVTLVTFEVREVILGDLPATIELEFLGGEIDGEGMLVAGQPKFEVGDEDILFVAGNRVSLCPLVAMMYGRYLVVRESETQAFVARENGVPLTAVQDVSNEMVSGQAARVLAQLQVDGGLSVAAFSSAIRERAEALGRRDVTRFR